MLSTFFSIDSIITGNDYSENSINLEGLDFELRTDEQMQCRAYDICWNVFDLLVLKEQLLMKGNISYLIQTNLVSKTQIMCP
jgi:hypothetical protein